MISTYSKFYYGIEITSDNKYLDFDEGAGEINAYINVGFHSLDDLRNEIETALNTFGINSYTVTCNRDTRKFTITSDSAMDMLWDTGLNSASSVGTTIGFNVGSDDLAATSFVSDNAIGSVYSPQFKLQDYISSDDYRMLRNATKNKSAIGLVEVINFGTEKYFEFSIKFATNIYQPSSGPIINDSAGVQNLRAFMQYIIKGAQIEFMPDKNDEDTYYKLLLDTTSSEGSGMGYKLQEQYGRGLVGYFETGILKFRELEV